MSSSGFLPKKASDPWLTYLVYKYKVCYFGGKPLEPMFCIGSQKKLTLVKIIVQKILIKNLIHNGDEEKNVYWTDYLLIEK